MPLDYSKWNNIEVSDDEDDTHPNIDTPSLFRWRHRARVERDTEWNQNKEKHEATSKDIQTNLASVTKKLDAAKLEVAENKESSSAQKKVDELEAECKKLVKQQEDWEKADAELKKQEKKRAWNIDTMCHEGKTKTIINTADLKTQDPPNSDGSSTAAAKNNEEDSIDRMRAFIEKNEPLIKKYGMFRRPTDTQQFLQTQPHLVCEETANHLVLWCIDLAMEEKQSLMEHVSHQCIVMQFMLELAKSLKIDPRACIRPFFAKFASAEPEYQAAFNDELSAFRQRIKARAKARIEEAVERQEEEERQKRLGPGGLDPVEVFQQLPESLQRCFEAKDIEMLKKVMGELEPTEANRYFQMCVDSGMWVPDKNAVEGDGEEVEPDANADADTSVEEAQAKCATDGGSVNEAGNAAELVTSAGGESEAEPVYEQLQN